MISTGGVGDDAPTIFVVFLTDFEDAQYKFERLQRTNLPRATALDLITAGVCRPAGAVVREGVQPFAHRETRA